MTTRRTDLGRITLNVLDEGARDGHPVLLLHGFPDSSRLWRNQVPALVDAGYRAIAPDLRGFGDSDRPERVRDYRMPVIVDDVRALLDALDISTAHVVGHDWGAIVAWAVAGNLADRVDRLVAITVGHPRVFSRVSPAQLARSWYVMFFQIPKLPEALIRARDWRLFRKVGLFGTSPDIDRYIEDLSRPGALTAGINWYRANRPRPSSWNWYPRVSVPTMGIWGAKDGAVGEKQMTDSVRYVDGPWRYERMEAGHWLPLTRAQQLNELLIGFLDE